MSDHNTDTEHGVEADGKNNGNGNGANGNIAVFAQTNYRNQSTRFGIKTDDRRRHLYVLGKTGMGKTNLLNTMAIKDIQAGHGIGVIDPHGEFIEGLLDHIPRSRMNDVIYVNPADLDWPVAFNILEKVPPEHRHLVASGVVGVFKKIWADSWGPRLEYVLRNGILALLESESSTLLGIMRILIDKEFRKKIISRVQDPTVRTFWTEEFTKYPDRFQAEAVAPIQNKVGQFLSNPLIRNVVGQTTTAFNLREVMDGGKILLLNLSKGRIGEDASALLGAMMVTKIQLAAMSRVDIPEGERRDFYLYVDEFQNFATESFANILSEARKYRLNLILAHQYITQLPEEVCDAVFGNVGTLVAFRVGADDAEFLEREFTPEFTAQDLVNLAKYNIYLKLMIDGVSSRAFSAGTLPPPEPQRESYKEKIIRISRERYSTRRLQVEDRIVRWYGLLPNQGESGSSDSFQNKPKRPSVREDADIRSGTKDISRGRPGEILGVFTGEPQRGERGATDDRAAPWRSPASDRELFEAVCANCQKKAMIPFKPDGIRPVWCDDCHKKIQSGELVVPPRSPGARISERAPRPPLPEGGASRALPGREYPQKKQAPLFARAARAKRPIDVAALRQVLKETLFGQETTQPKPPMSNGENQIPPKRPEQDAMKKEGVLKAGETVTLK